MEERREERRKNAPDRRRIFEGRLGRRGEDHSVCKGPDCREIVNMNEELGHLKEEVMLRVDALAAIIAVHKKTLTWIVSLSFIFFNVISGITLWQTRAMAAEIRELTKLTYPLEVQIIDLRNRIEKLERKYGKLNDRQ